MQAMKYLEVEENEKKAEMTEVYFDHLKLNKIGFETSITETKKIITEKTIKKGNDAKVIKLLKAISRCKMFTDDQDKLITRMRKTWEEGNIPASISKEVIKQTKIMNDPIKIFYEIKEMIPDKYFEARKDKKRLSLSGSMKVILSSYLKKEDK